MESLVAKGDEPGIKLSVEMMVNNGADAPLQVDEAKRAGGGNGSVSKVSSPNKSAQSLPGSPTTDFQALAQKLSVQAVSKSRPDQWGLLSALSEKARKRTQGCHIMLHSSEHVLGRIVAEVSCMFESPAVSGRHCTVTRKLISFDGRIKSPGSDRAAGDVLGVFVKDSSSNGTFINKEKLKKNGPEVRLRHGDIMSLVALPEHENAFAFVFRELVDDSSCKRKGSPSDLEADVCSAGEGKRVRSTGKGVAASEGPVSLDDVRRLQRSNEELRQQLEANVLDMEKMRGEFRAAEASHLVELKELRASVTELYVQQIEEIRLDLVSKSKEVEESTALCVQQESSIEDLKHRLASAAQSRVDAEEAISSQTVSINELKKRLDDEFSQHQKERAEWEANLEAAVERSRMEASEELKRHSEASSRFQKQQQEIIADLQEADRENRRLADNLRMKLEAERQAVIEAEEKGRRLGMQLQEERISAENASKRAAELEEELKHVQKELESEKEGRESAGAKVASLELAMETAIRDLTLEKQRLQGARERIVLRETQLRTFYSTTAEVVALQQKQQEQLKVMLRTLEDGDGEGEYSQSKKPKPVGQTDCLGDEAKILASLTARQTPFSTDASLLVEGKGLRVRTGNADGEETKMPIQEGERTDQDAGLIEPDWMDGDTQQEGQDCLVVADIPATSKAPSDVTIGVQAAVGEEEHSGTKMVNSNPDGETQVLQDQGMSFTTLMFVDTMQEVGASEGEAFLKESIGSKSRFWNETRKSNSGMDAPASVTPDDEIGEAGHETVGGCERVDKDDGGLGSGGATLETRDDAHGRSTMESVGTATAADNEGGPPGDSLMLKVLSRSGTYLDTQVEKTNNGAATICTEDLLTSEVAGSWAVGTQASVHTGHEVGSHRCMVGWTSGAHQIDTQLVRRDNDDTMCTDDLLASEVAGSWAVGTPASVHADNESISSDERDNPCPEEGGSQVAANIHLQVSRPRSNPHQVLLDEVMHFGDPVNSQNSLSPATTNPARNERDALNEMLDIVEPGFGSLHGLSRITVHQSDADDSTTDGEDENELNISSDGSQPGSQPLNNSPSVSVR